MKIQQSIRRCILAALAALTIHASPALFAEPVDNAVLLEEIRLLKERVLQLEAIVVSQQPSAAPLPSSASGSSAVGPQREMTGKSGAAGVADEAAAPSIRTKFPLEIYGYIKLDAFHDDSSLFTPEIPFWVQPANGAASDGGFQFTAKETRLGLNIGDASVPGYSAKLEVDLYGDVVDASSNHAYALRTRHAYVNWTDGSWSLLAGQTWDTILISMPTTLNFSYYNFMGQLGLRRAQLRGGYRKPLEGGSLEVQFALEDPLGRIHGGDLDGLGQDDGTDSGLPVFAAKVVWKTTIGAGKRPALAGLSGFWGEEHLDAAVGPGEDCEMWAVIAGGELPLGSRFALKGTLWTGENLDSVWGGIGQGINTTLHRCIAASGGWVQLGYKPGARLSFNLGYSIDDPDDGDLNNGMRSMNSSVLLNSYFNVTADLVWGIEYLRLETRYKNAPTATNDRIQSSLLYKF